MAIRTVPQIAQRRAGFTLVELLLVTVLLLLMLGGVIFSFSNLRKNATLDEGASQIEALFRYARAQAASSGRRICLDHVSAHRVLPGWFERFERADDCLAGGGGRPARDSEPRGPDGHGATHDAGGGSDLHGSLRFGGQKTRSRNKQTGFDGKNGPFARAETRRGPQDEVNLGRATTAQLVTCASGFPPQAARGAVLLEVLLALMLFAVTAAIITSSMNASMDGLERLKRNTHAANLASTVLAELELGLRPADASGERTLAGYLTPASGVVALRAGDGAEKSGESGEVSDLTQLEVILRHKDSEFVYRQRQWLKLPAASAGTDEPPLTAGAGGVSR